MIKHNAFMTTLIIFGGFFIALSKSSCFLSKTFNASYAARRAGIASAKSASHSVLILLAASTAYLTTFYYP
jgi:hypothetical protein